MDLPWGRGPVDDFHKVSLGGVLGVVGFDHPPRET